MVSGPGRVRERSSSGPSVIDGLKRWLWRFGALLAGLTATVGAFAAVAAGWAAFGDVGGLQISLAAVASAIGGLLTYLQVRKEVASRRAAEINSRVEEAGSSGRGRREMSLFELPADIVDFIGRQEYVVRLGAALESDRSSSGALPIVSIAGTGGVGKTTLAIHVAHRVRSRFPDGQIYVNLRGVDNQPLEPHGVLGAFLTSLSVAATAIPEDLQERARKYRAMLDGRRMLFVLDNAVDEAQLRPLLPGGGGCAVLVTSRRRLTGLDGAVTVDLDAFTPDQAVELLSTIVGARRFAGEPGVAGELAQLCGYLPLAVRIAGARLAAKQHWRPATYVARLRDERGRLDELHTGDREVRASLALSYAALSPDEQRVFRLVGLVPGFDFAAWPLAMMLSSTPNAAQDLLERLVDVQLVDAVGEDETGRMRYRLHDLLRVFARERLFAEDPPAVVETSLTRVLAGFLELTQHAATRLGWQNRWTEDEHNTTLVWPSAADPSLVALIERDPVVWFRVERDNLVAAVADAYDAELWELTWLLADSLFIFFESSAQWHAFEQVSEYALMATREAHDLRAEAITLRGIGMTQLFRGTSRDALERFDRCLKICATLGDRVGTAYTLFWIAVALRYGGRLEEALTQLDQCLPMFRDQHDELGTALVMRNFGVIHRHRGQFGQALSCLTDALAVFERRGAYLPAALTLYHRGAIHRDHGRLEESIACIERSADLLRRLDNHRIQIPVRRSLGEVHRLAGRFDDALVHLHETIAIAQDLGDRYGEAEARHTLGDVYRAQSQFSEAAACLTRSLEIFRKFNAHNAIAGALLSLGRLWHATGEYDQSERHFNECLEIARHHKFALVEARALLSFGALLEDCGKKDQAETAIGQAHVIFHQLNLPEIPET